MGGLLRELAELVDLPAETERLARESVEARNTLAHRFFHEHDVDILSEPGRDKMIAELRASAELFQTADRALVELREPLSSALGITPDLAQRELERILLAGDGD